MSADSLILEALARIEHKQDLLIQMVIALGLLDWKMTPLGHPWHTCPVCKQEVRYTIDIANGVIVRVCGCNTGKVVVDMKSFATPTTTKETNNERGQDSEDGNNSGSGRGTFPR